MMIWFDRKNLDVQIFCENFRKLWFDRFFFSPRLTKLSKKIHQIAWWCDLTEKSCRSKNYVKPVKLQSLNWKPQSLTRDTIVGNEDLVDDPFASALIDKFFRCCYSAAQRLGLVVIRLEFGQRHSGSQGSSLWSHRRLWEVAIAAAIIVDTRHDADFSAQLSYVTSASKRRLTFRMNAAGVKNQIFT